jgi:L-ascorbate metabolism protein UlaG (beta-lactamase superfamily)
MRATSIGHAGILVETGHGSIVCDPWFVPAFFGSWFVFPATTTCPSAAATPSNGRTISTSRICTPIISTSPF